MRVLVTGGCGFIGHHLVKRLLHDQHDVTVLDNNPHGPYARLIEGARLVQGDVTIAEDCQHAMRGKDLCVHLAAIASVAECTRDWTTASATNLMGTVNILAAAKAAGPVPVVFASSAAVYGAGAVPLDETSPVQPLSNYGIDKLASEMQARFAGDVGGVPTAILRFFKIGGVKAACGVTAKIASTTSLTKMKSRVCRPSPWICRSCPDKAALRNREITPEYPDFGLCPGP